MKYKRKLKYKLKRPPNLEIPGGKPQFAEEPEQLLGEVNGMPASDLEERLYKASFKNPNVRNRYFRLSLGEQRGQPGWLELDYLFDTVYGWNAVEVDDVSFVHKGNMEKEEARLKDLRRLDGLKQLGIEIREITHVTNEELNTQDDADDWVMENL